MNELMVNGEEYSSLSKNFTGKVKERDLLVNGKILEGQVYYFFNGEEVTEEEYYTRFINRGTSKSGS